MSELASTFGIHPVQITQWKKQALAEPPEVFGKRRDREAEDHEAVKGFSQMNKEHLIPALCKALGLESHAHHEVVGIDKTSIKTKIRQLKVDRAKAIEAHDHARLKVVRRTIHHLKRRIHAATV